MPIVQPFSDEQLRIIVNLRQHYEVWLEAERHASNLPYGMQWKTVSGKDYLYEVLDRRGNAKSLGRRNSDNENIYNQYRETKINIQERIKTSRAKLEETCQLYRSLRLPMVASEAAKILREADRRALLGSHLIVVGTNAIASYAIEAGGKIGDIPDETDDFDLTWAADESVSDCPDGGKIFWSLLKAVDSTYTVNTERSFQARNSKAYEIELLAAPSRFEGIKHRKDRPTPIPLPEQEWLLLGKQVSQVVVARDASPAHIVAPDPRWFALQKIWLSRQDKRNPLKRRKDETQGFALLTALREAMPQFPLDDQFVNSLPSDLLPGFETWQADQVIDDDQSLSW